MDSSTREITGGSRRPSRRPVESVCLSELRAGLAQRCETGEVCDAVDAVVGPLLASPLVGGDAVRAADDDDLVWSAQQVQRALNALEGARSTLVAEAARRQLHTRRGEASTAETLVGATSLSGAAARRVEREAVALGGRPEVADALSCGEINADQAAAVAAADVPPEVRSELCGNAKTQTADQTRRAVRAAEAAGRTESETQRRARLRAARSASMWIDPRDGMWHLRAKFEPLTGDQIYRRLMQLIQQNWRSDKDLSESQRRSVTHRAADALAHVLTADGGPKAHSNADDESWVVPSSTQMIVLTSLDNLRNNTPQTTPPLLAVPGVGGVTEMGTELSAGEMRKLACDARVVPVVMGGASEVLDVGRATRTIPPAIRRALIARDQGCVWPGCERAPIHCDGHHIQHWIDDGPTCLTNLALLCHSHHHRLHEYNLVLHPPTGPAPPGMGWTVASAPPPTPARPSTKQIC
ncbi:DUF222 domain-containing protein [Candidatus Poriferisodalis sp.]|uniref:HNH endonuclease signature motif containing protein n=1 Tax=Candidatus Poriferisodalis sp. TaxID=3101277 RepID=UPI003B5C4A53